VTGIGFTVESSRRKAAIMAITDWKIELIILPVTDVDRSKEFYVDRIGFVADHDQTVTESLRFVQLTPPGSACSIAFGVGLTDMEPGSQRGLQIVIPNADEAYEHLIANGVEATPVDEQAWGRFVTFTDPDGNAWALQELPAR
jgi:catechol 2,3-dioxygenase-like lactoylglutathione lyase family enzyme